MSKKNNFDDISAMDILGDIEKQLNNIDKKHKKVLNRESKENLSKKTSIDQQNKLKKAVTTSSSKGKIVVKLKDSSNDVSNKGTIKQQFYKENEVFIDIEEEKRKQYIKQKSQQATDEIDVYNQNDIIEELDGQTDFKAFEQEEQIAKEETTDFKAFEQEEQIAKEEKIDFKAFEQEEQIAREETTDFKAFEQEEQSVKEETTDFKVF
ncbi:MAG: hypothetical protein ACRCZK_02195, partial [Oscillospiraceae bacterium]